jgi:hypothetical protein
VVDSTPEGVFTECQVVGYFVWELAAARVQRGHNGRVDLVEDGFDLRIDARGKPSDGRSENGKISDAERTRELRHGHKVGIAITEVLRDLVHVPVDIYLATGLESTSWGNAC